MTLQENIRQLRLERGMTQEQVAEKIGMTRQALSSYESGRTRPDIDTLIKLSEIYGTDLHGLLYGRDHQRKAVRRIGLTGKLLFALLAVLTGISSAFLWSANHFFALSEGQLSAEEMRVFASHQKLVRAWEMTDHIILAIAFLGFFLLMLFLITGRGVIPLKTKLQYAAGLSAVILSTALLFGAADPALSAVNYVITPVLVIGRMIAFLLADLIAESFQRRKA